MKSPARVKRSWRFVGRSSVVGVVGLASMIGCGGANDASSDVWGRVVYHGQPIRGGVIVFAPSDGRDTDWGVGVIKQDGEFYVIPSEGGKPLPPGRYDVSFRRPPDSGSSSSDLQIPEKYLDSDNPYFSMELRRLPAEILITLRD